MVVKIGDVASEWNFWVKIGERLPQKPLLLWFVFFQEASGWPAGFSSAGVYMTNTAVYQF